MGNKTAREAGWHLSRYNLRSRLPETGETVIVNLYAQTIMKCSVLEEYLLDISEELNEDHPILPKLKTNGFLVNFDEKALLDSMGRVAACYPGIVSMTICPTLACNFDCPYCFEQKREGRMTRETQDKVLAFAEKMIKTFKPRTLSITWFGGEPLLGADIIESLSVRLIALAEANGLEYVARIITNGYLLTAENTAMLARCRVNDAQITVDGIGPGNDATRRLAGGGGTYERIMANLTDHPIPFKVHIRQNIYEGNRDEMTALKEAIGAAAGKSGNKLIWYPDLAVPSEAAEARGENIAFLERHHVLEADLFKVTQFQTNGFYCMAQRLCDVVIDEQGRLYKCWEDVDTPAYSFGTLDKWDPAVPTETADRMDMLTRYLNTACPVPDDECAECIWLPLCRGGCPHLRLLGKRACLAFREHPDAFAAMLYKRQEKERT